MVGNFLETSPEIVKRMIAEGHTVGNHTYHHLDMSSISSMDAFKKETQDVENLFEQITGTPITKFYRPPQGKYNIENLKMAQELGYHTFFWSLAYVDWYQDKQPTKDEAFGKLLKKNTPRRNRTVTFHVFDKCADFRRIVDQVGRNGLYYKTVDRTGWRSNMTHNKCIV